MQRAGSGPAFSPIAAQRPARTSAIDSPRGAPSRNRTSRDARRRSRPSAGPRTSRSPTPRGRGRPPPPPRSPPARSSAAPVEGADEDPREVDPAEPPCEARRIALATLRQGQVGPPGVLPRERPGRLAVPRPSPRILRTSWITSGWRKQRWCVRATTSDRAPSSLALETGTRPSVAPSADGSRGAAMIEWNGTLLATCHVR